MGRYFVITPFKHHFVITPVNKKITTSITPYSETPLAEFALLSASKRRTQDVAKNLSPNAAGKLVVMYKFV